MEQLLCRHSPAARLPIVPDEILARFQVGGIADTRFTRCARLLQSVWRERRGMESGWHKPKGRTSRRLGNLLAPTSALTGATFMDAEIARLVRREVAYREYGALINERRLWQNLLSSQTLTFNLLGRAKLDLAFASRLFASLLPNDVTEVHQIGFEHSPGRGNPSFLGDYTALDAFAHGISPLGEPVFIGIEVKYAESMQRPERGGVERLRELARSAGFYRDPDEDALFAEPFAQFTAEHLLTGLIAKQLGSNARGVFMVIAPEENREAAKVVERYRSLIQPESAAVPFHAVSLEAVIRSMIEAGDPTLADQLTERYLDLAPVHELIDQWAPSFS